ncbi:unnamed protein product [Polarella glacialis]|uniref:Nucleoside phosphorylase domain-containing protein n=1 Tax=Polarella glacialis TaxID=89957 RepID=A0A813JP02_POLGL|nr:unnamed protein product [Polarella glacialis]
MWRLVAAAVAALEVARAASVLPGECEGDEACQVLQAEPAEATLSLLQLKQPGLCPRHTKCGGCPQFGIIAPNDYERVKLAEVANLTDVKGYQAGGFYFERGSFDGIDVVVVTCGLAMVNSAAATTLMVELYNPGAIMMYGIAGAVSSSVNFADVVGIDYSRRPPNVEFVFPGYTTHPVTGTFYVQTSEIMVETPQETGKFERELFMQVDAKLLAAAQKVVADGNLKLQSCLPDTSRCLVPAPVVQVQPDRAGASASIFVDNDSWRKFLDQKLKVSTTDMETSAAAQVCKAFGVPFLAFRSASDKAGGDPSTNEAGVFSDLAAGSAAVAMYYVVQYHVVHVHIVYHVVYGSAENWCIHFDHALLDKFSKAYCKKLEMSLYDRTVKGISMWEQRSGAVSGKRTADISISSVMSLLLVIFGATSLVAWRRGAWSRLAPLSDPGDSFLLSETDSFLSSDDLAIREALLADEDRRWRQQGAQQSHWQRLSLTAWTVAELSHFMDSVESLQAYARLKLVDGQTTSHLVQRCPALRAERQVFGDMVASEGLPAGPGQLDVHATGETDSVPGVLAGICFASAVATAMGKQSCMCAAARFSAPIGACVWADPPQRLAPPEGQNLDSLRRLAPLTPASEDWRLPGVSVSVLRVALGVFFDGFLDPSSIQQLDQRYRQWGRMLLHWPNGSPSSAVFGELGWWLAGVHAQERAFGLFARLSRASASQGRRQLCARVFQHTRVTANSWAYGVARAITSSGIPLPSEWGIVDVSASVSLQAFSRYQLRLSMNRLVFCASARAENARGWTLARCGHHSLSDGRSVRHLGVTQPCLCGHSHCTLLHVLRSCQFFSDLRSAWESVAQTITGTAPSSLEDGAFLELIFAASGLWGAPGLVHANIRMVSSMMRRHREYLADTCYRQKAAVEAKDRYKMMPGAVGAVSAVSCCIACKSKAKVEKIVAETLDGYLKDMVPHWINYICETVMAKLNDTKKPFKYVVTCMIMQRNGAGVHSATSCYWDAGNDGVYTYVWPREKSKDVVNKSMYCIVTVFGLEF